MWCARNIYVIIILLNCFFKVSRSDLAMALNPISTILLAHHHPLRPRKVFNRRCLISGENLSTGIAAVADPVQNACITARREFVLQNPRQEALDHPFYQRGPDVGVSAQKDKNNDGVLQLADIWKYIQGSHDWSGILNPLNPLLLSEIVRYGVFVRACYEAFDLDPGSRFHGFCKYGRKSLLDELGLKNCGYKVKKYIYATPDINIHGVIKKTLEGDRSNWVGYVAITEDEKEIKRLGRRDIVVALRGTVTYAEWLANLTYTLTPTSLNPLNPLADVKVAKGLLGLYTSQDSTYKFNNGSAREQLLSEIARLVKKYEGEELSITMAGHSMGSAMATLCAYDIAELELNRTHYYSPSRIPITVYSFAGPRMGNAAFRERCGELGLRILRVVNVHDVVTKIPGVIFNEKFRLWENLMDRINSWSYSHVGVELALNHKLHTQFFHSKSHHPSCVHNLATYLQLLNRCSCNRHEHLEQANSEFPVK